jgi:hypothetical protein
VNQILERSNAIGRLLYALYNALERKLGDYPTP